jgi:hypothetical protein
MFAVAAVYARAETTVHVSAEATIHARADAAVLIFATAAVYARTEAIRVSATAIVLHFPSQVRPIAQHFGNVGNVGRGGGDVG